MSEMIKISNKRESGLIKLALYSLSNIAKYFRDIERDLYKIRSYYMTYNKPFDSELEYLRFRKNDVYDVRNRILDRLDPVSIDIFMQNETIKYTNLDNPEEYEKYKDEAIKGFTFSDWGKNYRGIIILDKDNISRANYFVNYEIDGIRFTRRVSEDEFNEKFNHLPSINRGVEELPFSEFDLEFNNYMKLETIVKLLNEQPKDILEYYLTDPTEDDFNGYEIDTYNILISKKERNILFNIEPDLLDDETSDEFESIEFIVEYLNDIEYYYDVAMKEGYESTLSYDVLENFRF